MKTKKQEQSYDKKRWGLSERQNSIKFKTKYECSINGRIGWRQKKWEWNEQQNRMKTEKSGSGTNGRIEL